jgi:hypothetical protein
MIRRFATFGLRPATINEIPHALALAEELTGQDMAQADVVIATHSFTGSTVLVLGQPIIGVFINILLSEAGVEAVTNGTFYPGKPDRSHIAGIGEVCHGLYTGVYAGRTRDARRQIMQCSATLRVEFFGSIPLFARAATDDGARSMASLGFRPASGGLKDLWVNDPAMTQSGAAA